MTTAVQHRRGTTAEHSTFTGLEGEVTIDTTKDTAVIHDGVLAGGYPLAKENLANVTTSGLSSIDGASTASDDKFFIYDQSATTLKTITRAELNNAIEQDALANVAITGGTINGTAIGGTTAAAGAFTTLSSTGNTTLGDASGDSVTINGNANFANVNPTLTAGTANGVAYLNGSKVLTTGSALTFDGTNFKVGGESVIIDRTGGDPYLTFYTSGSANNVSLYGGASTGFRVFVAGSEQMRLTSKALMVGYTSDSGFSGQYNAAFSGSVGIGTSSPGCKLDVAGSASQLFRINSTNASGGGLTVQTSGADIGYFGAAKWIYGGSYSANDLIVYAANNMSFGTNSTQRMLLDSSGNLGLGVAPSGKSKFEVATGNVAQNGVQVWYNSSNTPIALANTTSNAFPYVGFNTVQKTSSDNQTYAIGNHASRLKAYGGGFSFDIAGSGTAGADISWTQAMTLDASGNLGVGITSPTSRLHLKGPAGSNPNTNGVVFQYSTSTNNFGAVGLDNASGDLVVAAGSGCSLRFYTNSDLATTNERARIDTSGTLLIGQTSKTTGATSGAKLGVTAGITVTNGSYGGFIEGINTSGTLSGYLSFGSSYNAFNAGEVGLGTSGSVDLLFATNNAVRGRFTSGGYFKASSNGTYVNSTASYHEFRQTTSSQTSVYNTNTTADPYGIRMSYTGASPNSTDNWFLYCEDSGPTLRMSVRSNGGIANYSGNNVNLSDRREKTNFAPAGEYLSKICAIPVQTFNYIDQNVEEDPGLTLGVVAQDVQAVAPELVMESNWGTKDEPKMRLSIYQTDLQYALMKALQELKAEFDAYKATHP